MTDRPAHPTDAALDHAMRSRHERTALEYTIARLRATEARLDALEEILGGEGVEVLRPATAEDLHRMFPIACERCGKPVESGRRPPAYAHPTCYACLPPPAPLPILHERPESAPVAAKVGTSSIAATSACASYDPDPSDPHQTEPTCYCCGMPRDAHAPSAHSVACKCGCRDVAATTDVAAIAKRMRMAAEGHVGGRHGVLLSTDTYNPAEYLDAACPANVIAVLDALYAEEKHSANLQSLVDNGQKLANRAVDNARTRAVDAEHEVRRVTKERDALAAELAAANADRRTMGLRSRELHARNTELTAELERLRR